MTIPFNFKYVSVHYLMAVSKLDVSFSEINVHILYFIYGFFLRLYELSTVTLLEQIDFERFFYETKELVT